MSAKVDNEKEPVPAPETQSQRWAKYGSNVALMIVLSIVVAGLVTYVVQAHDVRVDTTIAGVNSLKPQTVNVLHDLNQDVKIISLYSKADATDTDTPHKEINKPAMVSDLLDNYKRASSHITTEVIDPISEKAKIDQLTTELEERYGKEIKNYQQFLTQYEKVYPQLTKLTADEAQKATGLADKLPDDKTGQLLKTALTNVQTDVPRMLSDNKSAIDRLLKEHHPDYKSITSGLEEFLKKVSQFEGGLADGLPQFKDNPSIPQPVRDYITGAIPRFQAVKKIADDQIAAIGKLGELKVDELKRALNVVNPILILGPTDWRILSETQIWPENNNVKMYSDGKVAPNFAGEQQITSAIVALTSTKKPKVAFLRPGGAPLTTPGFPPFVQG
ncbi:MAG TPA: Gldg family protein, partial [Chloroflexota bacterium]|nr:Gldg family protein [Chloroflexota bacterium]